MRAQRCRAAARLLQSVKAPWRAEAACSSSSTVAADTAAFGCASHHAAADHNGTQGGGGSCWPGGELATASSQPRRTSGRCRWTGPPFHGRGLGSSRGYSSLAGRQLELSGVGAGGGSPPPLADREFAAAAAHDMHGDSELAAGNQHALAVGGPVAHGAAAVTRWLVEEGVLPQEAAEKAVDRIVHFYSSYGSRRRPSPLLVSVREVQPVVETLRQLPGLDLRRCLTRWPHILVGTPAARLDLNRRLLERRLEMRPAEVGRLATNNPFLLREHLPDRLFPVLDYLAGLGISTDRLRGLILRDPLAFNYGKSKIQERVIWLRRLGLDDAQLQRTIWGRFRILTSTDHQSNDAVAWLLECGVPRERLAALVTRFPAVLIISQEKRSALLAFFRDELGMDRDAIARLLVRVPDTVGRTLELLRRNVQVMQEVAGFDLASLQRLVASNPGVLRLDLSSPTYAAKLSFAREVLQVPADQLPAFLVGQPFFLQYRLDRIAARAFFLQSRGLLPLRSMASWLASSEPLFCTKFVKCTVGDYHAWRTRWRASAEGQYWLQQAALRSRSMSGARLAWEAAEGEGQEVEAALEAEAAAAAEAAQRLRAAQRLLRQGPGPGRDHLQDAVARAAAQVEPAAQRAEASEQASRAALSSLHERHAAGAEQPAP